MPVLSLYGHGYDRIITLRAKYLLFRTCYVRFNMEIALTMTDGLYLFLSVFLTTCINNKAGLWLGLGEEGV